MVNTKQERYPVGGIRSKPAKKMESPARRHYNNLKLKQQSADIICTTPGARQMSPTDHPIKKKMQPVDRHDLNRKSVNESVRRSAVTVNELVQRTRSMAKAPKAHESANLSQSAQLKQHQYHSKAYSQPIREPVRHQERHESAFRKRSNPIKTHQYKGGNPQ